MKTFLLASLLIFAGFEIPAQTPPRFPAPRLPNTPPRQVPPRFPPGMSPQSVPAASPVTAPRATAAPNTQAAEETIPAGTIDFPDVDVDQVLDVYAKLVNRTVIRGTLPAAHITLKTQTPLTRTEAIQALQEVLALNNITVINVGDKFVKAVQATEANAQGDKLNDVNTTNLPDLGPFITRVVQLKYVKPSVMAPILAQFAKLPNAIFPVEDNGILIIRDYTENVKRMLEMIAKIDVDVPTEYISEVIPIRYAKVDDIANALNSLGSGGGTVSAIGSAPSSSKISGFSHSGGMSGISSMGGSGGFGGGSPYGGGTTQPYGSITSANGMSTGGSTFAQRLNNIINKASGSGSDKNQIQLFGQTKIVPNESSSSLLVFATRTDMSTITNIVAKLDVPLAQVLVEAVIIDYSLGPNTFSFGTSVAQNPKTFSGNSTNIIQNIIGGGGFNNGTSFYNFLNGSLGTNTTSGLFGNSLGSGLSYFGNLGPTWDVALSAVAADSHANIIQRPRIQAEQAKPAQFFVGDTVPYVTGNTYGGVYGNSASYSQLSVGVELDVTPFINPDGEVAMDIQQEIDDLNGFTTITGVGQVPNTIKRTLNTSMTVRDRDTVMLGGFIKSNTSTSRTGVPFLQDIPLLGMLFSQRNDSKQREELIVLMRPTVLATPELAAKHTIIEEQRLPGDSAAAAEDAAGERKLIDEERKREQKQYEKTKQRDGFYMQPPTGTNAVPAGINRDEPVIPSTASPAQRAQLNALFNSYLANEITTEQYQSERQKILKGSP